MQQQIQKLLIMTTMQAKTYEQLHKRYQRFDICKMPGQRRAAQNNLSFGKIK